MLVAVSIMLISACGKKLYEIPDLSQYKTDYVGDSSNVINFVSGQVGLIITGITEPDFDSMYHTYQPMYIPKGSNFKYTAELKKHVNIPVIFKIEKTDEDVTEQCEE